MTKSKWSIFIGLLVLCLASLAAWAGDSKSNVIPPVPTPGLVTMVDLGARKCIPCKMMAPIIADLQKEYNGRASIIFIDVWEHREQVQRFGIRAIPTQIFFDDQGREAHRNTGFMDKKQIVEVLTRLGVS